ncbi:MAG: mitochondrial amidoxime reducing component 2 [Candidatus Saccharibacteria bacterium]|nr:mitochondrial amidoxime reducing component 2 [Candidatus Saccharibacteria bacterium]
MYPIKSCQEATAHGKTIVELEAGSTGLKYGEIADRGWVVANPDNLFVSQRGWDESQARKYREDRMLATVAIDIQSDHLAISAPGHGAVDIAFEEPETKQANIRIFGPDLPVLAEGAEASNFFSSLISRSVKLWRADPNRSRVLPQKYQRDGAVNRAAGADGRPVSLASQASLNYLHDLTGLPRGTVPLINFRANVDIKGSALGAFGEDTIRTAELGSIPVFVIKALARCPVPNFNQTTGDDSQRLATKILRSRMGWALGEDTSSKAEPFFAQSLNHKFIPGLRYLVRVGDPVTIIEAGEPNVILKSSAA